MALWTWSLLVTLSWLVVCDAFVSYQLDLHAIQKKSLSRWSSHRLFAKKFDPHDIVTVEVTKPLGVELVENEEGRKSGVYVADLDPTGSLGKTGKVSDGMYLLTVDDQDVRYEGFDEIINLLTSYPSSSHMRLTFIDPQKVKRGSAIVQVVYPDKSKITLNAYKGQNLRHLLLDAKLDLYNSRGKYTNCAGGGTCGTCAVEVFGTDYWMERADFEMWRLRKYSPDARLACATQVEGDCTVVLQPTPTSAAKSA
eukprot:gene8363-9215_t